MSSRPDVAPPSYTAELEKLQDQIPPFPSAQAMAVLQAELGAPASVHFSELSPEPAAAASLGQARHDRRVWKGNGNARGMHLSAASKQLLAAACAVFHLVMGRSTGVGWGSGTL